MRRDNAHAAGVLAGIALADGFVVARAQERHDAAAVAEGKQRAFVAFEKFLNHHFRARLTKTARFHHRPQRVFGLGAVLTNHHALARGKSARLDHRRISAVLHIGERRIEFAETGVGGGFHAIFLHKILGETLAAFQLRRLAIGAENGEPCRLKNINDSFNQQRLCADKSQADVLFLRKRQQIGNARQRNIAHPLHRRRARIAGGDKNLPDAGILGEFPGERVLTPACANNQNIQHVILFLYC